MDNKHKPNQPKPKFDKQAYLAAAEKVAQILKKEKLQKQHA